MGAASCPASYSWAFNKAGHDPCYIASVLRRQCDSSLPSYQSIGPGQSYSGPSRAEGNKCTCSSVVYGMAAACADCQNASFDNWKGWSRNCGEVYEGYIPMGIPTGAETPNWVYDPSIHDPGFQYAVAYTRATGNPAPPKNNPPPPSNPSPPQNPSPPASNPSPPDPPQNPPSPQNPGSPQSPNQPSNPSNPSSPSNPSNSQGGQGNLTPALPNSPVQTTIPITFTSITTSTDANGAQHVVTTTATTLSAITQPANLGASDSFTGPTTTHFGTNGYSADPSNPTKAAGSNSGNNNGSGGSSGDSPTGATKKPSTGAIIGIVVGVLLLLLVIVMTINWVLDRRRRARVAPSAAYIATYGRERPKSWRNLFGAGRRDSTGAPLNPGHENELDPEMRESLAPFPPMSGVSHNYTKEYNPYTTTDSH